MSTKQAEKLIAKIWALRTKRVTIEMNAATTGPRGWARHQILEEQIERLCEKADNAGLWGH